MWTGWYAVSDESSVVFENAVAPELSGAGIEITEIRIVGQARNSASAAKQLQLGFKPALNSGRYAWSTYNGMSVLAPAFTAVYSSNGDWKYSTVTLLYSGVSMPDTFALFAGYIREQFTSGRPIYLGIIQPRDQYETQIYISGGWTITITYELLGNVPSANTVTAVLGSTSISTTINKVIPGSNTTLTYKIGNNVLYTENIGASTSHTYVVPASAGSYFPTSKTAVLTIQAETFFNGESYGVVETSVSIVLPDDSTPTCTCSVTRTWEAGVDTGAQIDAYVQNKSGVELALVGSAKYGATITGYATAIDGKSYLGDAVHHSPISESGDLSYSYTVTDSRGLSQTYTNSLSVLTWNAPQATLVYAKRVLPNGNEAIDGTCVKVSVRGGISSLLVNGEEKNVMNYWVAYRRIGDEDWVLTDVITAEGTSVATEYILKKNLTTISDFNDMDGYELRLFVSDIYTQSTDQRDIPTKETIIDFHYTSGSIGFGGQATGTDGSPCFDFYYPVNFRSDVSIFESAYSISEQPVGMKWIDGRPIYRQTLMFPPLAGGGTAYASLGYAVSEIDAVISVHGFTLGPSNGLLKIIPSPDPQPALYTALCDLDVSDPDDLRVRVATGSYLALPKGYFVIVEYTKAADAPTYYRLPYLAANTDAGCTITASSEFDASFQRVYAFMGPMYSRYWATTVADTERWIQVEMPYKLTNMIVTLMNPAHASPVPAANQPVSGVFYGSNDGIITTQIGTFTNRPTTEGATTKHYLGNSVAYRFLRVQITQPATDVWTGLADIRVEGSVSQ